MGVGGFPGVCFSSSLVEGLRGKFFGIFSAAAGVLKIVFVTKFSIAFPHI